MARRSVIALSILAVIIAAGLALQTPIMRGLRHFTWDRTVALTAKMAGIGSLKVDNDVLAQLGKLRVENIRLQAEKADYDKLRAQLGSAAFDNLRTIPALAGNRPLDTFRTEIMLNKGVDEGVVLQAPVVVNGSVLIGYITDTAEHSAVCRLLFNPQTSLSAEVLGVDNSRGLLRGQNFTSLALTTIPRDAHLSAGQSVVTVADGQTPAGLLIGAVGKVSNAQNEAYQEIGIRVPYDPDDFRALTVLVAP